VPNLTGNHLLDGLSDPVRETILRSAEPMEMPLRTSLYTADAIPSHLYFLTAGLASVVVSMREGGTSEVSMVGKDGLSGAIFLLGPKKSAATCFMQVSGRGLRVPLSLLRELFATQEEFRSCILEQMQGILNVSMQSTGCAALHEAEARLARWLLMTADRADSESVDLTQEFMAEMMGTQRTTVAVVAGLLRKAGFIDYTRGRILITDRPGLMEAACECYAVGVDALKKSTLA